MNCNRFAAIAALLVLVGFAACSAAGTETIACSATGSTVISCTSSHNAALSVPTSGL